MRIAGAGQCSADRELSEDIIMDVWLCIDSLCCALTRRIADGVGRVLLAVGSVDNSVRLLLAPPGCDFAPACRLTGHADWVRSLAFQRDAGAPAALHASQAARTDWIGFDPLGFLGFCSTGRAVYRLGLQQVFLLGHGSMHMRLLACERLVCSAWKAASWPNNPPWAVSLIGLACRGQAAAGEQLAGPQHPPVGHPAARQRTRACVRQRRWQQRRRCRRTSAHDCKVCAWVAQASPRRNCLGCLATCVHMWRSVKRRQQRLLCQATLHAG